MTSNDRGRDGRFPAEDFGAPSGRHADYRRQAAQYFGTPRYDSDPPTGPITPPIDRHGQFPRDAAVEQQPPNPYAPLRSPTPHPGPSSVLFALQPWHALSAVSGICLVAAVFSSSTFGWILLALLCAGGGWYARSRNAGWPSDVHGLLVRRRLAAPAPSTSTQASPPPQRATAFSPQPVYPTPPVGAAAVPPIPFRAMTIPELFTGAAKIIGRNWPTLVGIPVGILLAFVIFLYVSVEAVAHFVIDASSSLNGGTLFNLTDPSSFMSSLVILFIVFTVVTMAIALPADALLLAVSVIATDKAVRGQPVQLTDVWTQARCRMFAVGRMTLTFYAISALPDVVLIGLLSLGAGMASIFFSLAASFAVFVASIVFSLSPIVLVVEGRGVAESLRRSLSLSKPAWGRIIGIHMLWSVCIIPVVMVTLVFGFNLLVYAVAAGSLLACFRVLQVLIYTDLRIRQEHYEHQLIDEWTRNTGRTPV
jgi:hypothetical protein